MCHCERWYIYISSSLVFYEAIPHLTLETLQMFVLLFPRGVLRRLHHGLGVGPVYLFTRSWCCALKVTLLTPLKLYFLLMGGLLRLFLTIVLWLFWGSAWHSDTFGRHHTVSSLCWWNDVEINCQCSEEIHCFWSSLTYSSTLSGTSWGHICNAQNVCPITIH